MSQVITGWGVIGPDGTGVTPLRARMSGPVPESDRELPTDEPVPPAGGHAWTGFDLRASLGRKGTGSYDRVTALSVLACGEALADSGVLAAGADPARVGVVLGTTVGSLKSTCDFSRETLVQERPYLVNPVLFPNTVMNGAAGQVAIRHRLRGLNSTIAGGPLAFASVLRYAGNALRNGYADVILAGPVEEFSAHRAWASWHAGSGAPVGEGAAFFVLEDACADSHFGAHRDADVLAVATGFDTDTDTDGAGLTACVRTVLRRAGVAPSEPSVLFTGEVANCDDSEAAPVAAALGRDIPRIRCADRFGDCGAASGGLALATLLALHRDDPGRDGEVALLTARSPDGAVAAVLIRGWSRDGVAAR